MGNCASTLLKKESIKEKELSQIESLPNELLFKIYKSLSPRDQENFVCCRKFRLIEKAFRERERVAKSTTILAQRTETVQKMAENFPNLRSLTLSTELKLETDKKDETAKKLAKCCPLLEEIDLNVKLALAFNMSYIQELTRKKTFISLKRISIELTSDSKDGALLMKAIKSCPELQSIGLNVISDTGLNATGILEKIRWVEVTHQITELNLSLYTADPTWVQLNTSVFDKFACLKNLTLKMVSSNPVVKPFIHDMTFEAINSLKSLKTLITPMENLNLPPQLVGIRHFIVTLTQSIVGPENLAVVSERLENRGRHLETYEILGVVDRVNFLRIKASMCPNLRSTLIHSVVAEVVAPLLLMKNLVKVRIGPLIDFNQEALANLVQQRPLLTFEIVRIGSLDEKQQQLVNSLRLLKAKYAIKEAASIEEFFYKEYKLLSF